MLVRSAAVRGVCTFVASHGPRPQRLPRPRAQSLPQPQPQPPAQRPAFWSTATGHAPRRPPAQLPPRGRSHLPMEGAQGHWQGARGRSGWLSNHPGVQRITEGAPVIYRDSFPDFSPWAVERLEFDWLTLTGEARDMMRADAAMAAKHGCQRTEVTRLRKEARLLWHHCQDGQTMLLLPIDLHMHVPHTGGASMLRRVREEHAREASETGFAAPWSQFPAAAGTPHSGT